MLISFTERLLSSTSDSSEEGTEVLTEIPPPHVGLPRRATSSPLAKESSLPRKKLFPAEDPSPVQKDSSASASAVNVEVAVVCFNVFAEGFLFVLLSYVTETAFTSLHYSICPCLLEQRFHILSCEQSPHTITVGCFSLLNDSNGLQCLLNVVQAMKTLSYIITTAFFYTYYFS